MVGGGEGNGVVAGGQVTVGHGFAVFHGAVAHVPDKGEVFGLTLIAVGGQLSAVGLHLGGIYCRLCGDHRARRVVDGISTCDYILCAGFRGEDQRRCAFGNSKIKGKGMTAGCKPGEFLFCNGDCLSAGIRRQDEGAGCLCGTIVGEIHGELHRLTRGGDRHIEHDRFEFDGEHRGRNRADGPRRCGDVARSVNGAEPIVIANAVGKSGIGEAAGRGFSHAFQRIGIGVGIGGTQDLRVVYVRCRRRKAEDYVAAAHAVLRHQICWCFGRNGVVFIFCVIPRGSVSRAAVVFGVDAHGKPCALLQAGKSRKVDRRCGLERAVSEAREQGRVYLDLLNAVSDDGKRMPCEVFVGLDRGAYADVGILKGEPLDADPVGGDGGNCQIAVEAGGTQRIEINDRRRRFLLAGKRGDDIGKFALYVASDRANLIAVGNGGIELVVNINALGGGCLGDKFKRAVVFRAEDLIAGHVKAEHRLPSERDLTLAGLGKQRNWSRDAFAEGVNVGDPFAPVACGVKHTEADEDILRRACVNSGEVHSNASAIKRAVEKLGVNGVHVVIALPIHNSRGDRNVVVGFKSEGLRVGNMSFFCGRYRPENRRGIVPYH